MTRVRTEAARRTTEEPRQPLVHLATMELERTPELPEMGSAPAARSGSSLTGKDLLERPIEALGESGLEGSLALLDAYRRGQSHLHFVRSSSQPPMLRALLRSIVPAMVEDLLDEVGLCTPSARLLAEQAAEARADESYHRCLAGLELDKLEIARAERLETIADRHARRMSQALEQLHRLKRPRVNVKIARAGNVNFGEQSVSGSPDTLTSDG